ncbi:heavy-metal-associated domain-containing protein [Mycolicibacterium sp. HS_4_1]
MTLTDLVEPQNEVPGGRPIYLDITGMTCGMCSGRVQRALNKIDGVRASVSLATKTASIDAAGDITADQLCDAVRAVGYDATPRDAAPEIAANPAPGVLQRLANGLFGRTTS